MGVYPACGAAIPLASHLVELPFAVDAFQSARSGVDEANSGSGDQIRDGSGDEYLPRCGERLYTGGDMNGDPADVVPAQLDLAGVDASPDLDATALQRVADVEGA